MATTHGLKPEEVLCALYAHAQVLGMGFLHFRPGGMTLDEAKSILAHGGYIDYLRGRVMKVDLSEGGEVDDRLYNRDNGPGAAQFALDDYFTSTPENRITKYHTLA